MSIIQLIRHSNITTIYSGSNDPRCCLQRFGDCGIRCCWKKLGLVHNNRGFAFSGLDQSAKFLRLHPQIYFSDADAAAQTLPQWIDIIRSNSIFVFVYRTERGFEKKRKRKTYIGICVFRAINNTHIEACASNLGLY